ncbi:MAG: hypothetical protein P4M11_09610 [Candidatus Pacebacteria bacterium]|nr:hypothetical protein [Candidatus Paceibacterota bacterium]
MSYLHYVGQSNSRLTKQALGYLRGLGADVSFIDSDQLSDDVARATQVFIEVQAEHPGRYLLQFPDQPVRRLAFISRIGLIPPSFAEHAFGLIGIRKTSDGDIHRGKGCKAFYESLKRMHEGKLAQLRAHPKRRRRHHHDNVLPPHHISYAIS